MGLAELFFNANSPERKEIARKMEQRETPKKRKGFNAMDPEKQKQIASMGGKTAHERGTAHKWDRKTAIEAGRKGGMKSRRKPKDTE